MLGRYRFLPEYVEPRTAEPVRGEGLRECILGADVAARDAYAYRCRLHQAQGSRVDHVARLRRERDVQRDVVGLAADPVEPVSVRGAFHPELGLHVCGHWIHIAGEDAHLERRRALGELFRARPEPDQAERASGELLGEWNAEELLLDRGL